MQGCLLVITLDALTVLKCTGGETCFLRSTLSWSTCFFSLLQRSAYFHKILKAVIVVIFVCVCVCVCEREWVVECVSCDGGWGVRWDRTADASLLVPVARANKHQSEGTTAGEQWSHIDDVCAWECVCMPVHVCVYMHMEAQDVYQHFYCVSECVCLSAQCAVCELLCVLVPISVCVHKYILSCVWVCVCVCSHYLGGWWFMTCVKISTGDI